MARNEWNVGEAKQRFSEVIRDAAQEPQLIYNRDRLVAAVVSVSSPEEIAGWPAGKPGRSLAEAFAELRQIAKEDQYSLKVPERRNRPDPFRVGRR